MERSTVLYQDDAPVSPDQRLSSKLLTAECIRQKLSSAPFSVNNADAALLLACADMLRYQHSWLRDSCRLLPALTGLRSPGVDPSFRYLSGDAAAPRPPFTTFAASVPSSVPSDVPLSPSSCAVHSMSEKKVAARAQVQLIETLIRNAGTSAGGQSQADVVEAISPTAPPKFPKSGATDGVRSSDSSTSPIASSNSSSHCRNTNCGDRQQQPCLCESSTPPDAPWTLDAPVVDRARAAYDDHRHASVVFRPTLQPQWSCEPRATSHTRVPSAATYVNKTGVSQQPDEREMHPSFADFTDSEDIRFLCGKTTQTSLPSDTSLALQLYEASPSSLYKEQLQQHAPHMQVDSAAFGEVDRVFHGRAMEFHPAYPPLRDTSTSPNKDNVCGSPVSRHPTTTLSYAEGAYSRAPARSPDSTFEQCRTLYKKTDKQESSFCVSSAGLRTENQCKKYSLQGQVQFHAYKNVWAQEKCTVEVDPHRLYVSRVVSQKRRSLEMSPSHDNYAVLPTQVVPVQENEQLWRTTARAEEHALWPGNREIVDSCFVQLIQDVKVETGLTKQTQQHKIRKKPVVGASGRRKDIDEYRRKRLGSQDEGEMGPDPEKLQGEEKDYLQMAKKLPKLAGVIFDRLHKRWVSTYHDKETRKVMRKYFGVRKHGFEHAYQMAVKHRKMRMLAQQTDCDQFIVMQPDCSGSYVPDALEREEVEGGSALLMAQNRELLASGETAEEA